MLMAQPFVISATSMIRDDHAKAVTPARAGNILQQILKSFGYGLVGSEIQIILAVDVAEPVGRWCLTDTSDYLA